MEHINIPPFYIGQEVVANCDHHLGAFKKGDKFKVTSILKRCCQWCITVGIKDEHGYAKCGICHRERSPLDEWEFAAKRFSPKIEIKDFVSLKQFAERQLELIAAN